MVGHYKEGLNMKKEYVQPDFDVTVYEIEDDIALNISVADPDSGEEDWWG